MLNFIGCQGDIKGEFSKIHLSETINGMKVKLYIDIYDYNLCINCVFYCLCFAVFVVMANYNLHPLTLENMELTISYCLKGDILNFF